MERRTRARLPFALAAIGLSACESPMERVEPDPAAAPAAALPPARTWPPPAPQVMVAPPPDGAPDRAVLQPMTEEERVEAFRELVGTTVSYTPPPPEVPVRYVERDDGRYVSTAHVHSSACNAACSLGRAAVFTGLGAIIGHQFDDQGAGAAIGAGVALLTDPIWYGWSEWCDG